VESSISSGSAKGIPLSTWAALNPAAASILSGPVANTQAAFLINSSAEAQLAGFSTSEASVRRYRQAQTRSAESPQDGLEDADSASQPGGEELAASARSATSSGTFSHADRAALHQRLDAVLDQANLDPAQVQGMRVSQWDGMIKNADNEIETTTLYGVQLLARSNWTRVERVPTPAELSLLADYKPLIASARLSPDSAGTLVVALGDLQVGKAREKRGGTEELWERVRATTAAVVRYVIERGRPERIVLIHAGDCIEGTTSQGGRLIKRQDISLTAQISAYQRILELQCLELAAIAPLTVAVVNGNHDDVSRDFEPEDLSDGWATFAARTAQRYLQAARPDLSITWVYPERDHLTAEFEAVPGCWVAVAHGHKIASAPEKVMAWWKGQAFGEMPGAKSRLLVTGHWHHLRLNSAGRNRLHVQVPAMDGGSAWFAAKSGDDSEPGIVTFWLDQDSAYPVQDLRVHTA
jgi:Calcineurin-like phosphoesterase